MKLESDWSFFDSSKYDCSSHQYRHLRHLGLSQYNFSFPYLFARFLRTNSFKNIVHIYFATFKNIYNFIL